MEFSTALWLGLTILLSLTATLYTFDLLSAPFRKKGMNVPAIIFRLLVISIFSLFSAWIFTNFVLGRV